MDVDLKGRVAFVTGAAGAIGAATVRRLAQNGASVVVADINGEGARAVAAELPDAIGIAVDIRDEAAVAAAVDETLDTYGRLDILVNNAGVNTFKDRVTIDAFPPDEWRRVIGIDLDGLYLMSRKAVQPMIRQGGGRIVNIASVVGVTAMRLQSAFVAAKAARHPPDAIDGAGTRTKRDSGQFAGAGVGDDRGNTPALLWRERHVPGAGSGIHGAYPTRPAGEPRGNRRGHSLSVSAGKLIHDRPSSDGRRRLDSRFHAVSLRAAAWAGSRPASSRRCQ